MNASVHRNNIRGILILFISQFLYLHAQSLPFEPIPSWQSDESDRTTALAWGDVDQDGDLDLVAVNNVQPIRLYINEDKILQKVAFWSSQEYDSTLSVAWGDMDQDGDLDLAVGNWASQNKVYLNQGGILEATASWISDEVDNTYCVVWADVNNDGDLDLAVGNGGFRANELNRIYINLGGKLETTASWISFEQDPTTSIVLGDLNQDGYLDLAVGNNGVPDRIYMQSGGLLESAASWSSADASITSSLALGDIDGDGNLDLAVGRHESPASVYFNNSGGISQTPGWAAGSVDFTTDICLGDMNGDGYLDLAVANGSSYSGSVNRIYMNRDGKLETTAGWNSDLNNYSTCAVWGDMEGDGDLDLSFGNYDEPIGVYVNNGPMFYLSSEWMVQNNYTFSLDFCDVDKDHDLDLAEGNSLIGLPPPYYEPYLPVRLYNNNQGNLENSSMWQSGFPIAAFDVSWGDMNKDGFQDLAVAVGNISKSTGVFINQGGTLEQTMEWEAQEKAVSWCVAWGDVNGDSWLDLAVANTTINRVYLNQNGLLSSTAGWISSESDYTVNMAWGDVDRDGDLDLAVANLNEPNRVYYNNGGQLEKSASWISDDIDKTWSVDWGDVDGDGDLDLVSGNLPPQGKKIYFNNQGVLETSASWTSEEGSGVPYAVVWGDVNNDGDLDLIVGNGNNDIRSFSYLDYNRVYLNINGQLNRTADWTSEEMDRTNCVTLGDVDRDGDLDMAIGNILAPNRLYVNQYLDKEHWPKLPNQSSYIHSCYISKIDSQYNSYTIEYELVDHESDPCWIDVEYAPLGGGQWYNATEGVGSDGISHLQSSPDGIHHVYVWDAGSDNAGGYHVVLRLTVFSNPDRCGLIQRPAITYQLPVGFMDSRPYISVVSPKTNDSVGDSVRIFGQIWDSYNFDFYTIEYGMGVNPTSWTTIHTSYTPRLRLGELAVWYCSGLPENDYTIKITASDRNNNSATLYRTIYLVEKPPDSPHVIHTYPKNDTVDVSCNAPIIAQFDKKMNPVSITGYTMKLSDGINLIDGTVSYNYYTKTLTFIPMNPLQKNNFYYITIHENFQSEDSSPILAKYSWGFTTENHEMISVIERIEPSNGFTGFSLMDSIKVVYTNLNKYQIMILQDFFGHKVSPDTVLYDPEKKTRIFVPQNPLLPNTLYMITITDDTTGNGTGQYMSYFITADVLLPEIVIMLPLPNAVNVDLNSSITVHFNKDMNSNTITPYTFYVKQGGAQLDGIMVYDNTTRSVRFTPSLKLSQGSQYTVTVTSGVKDISGQSLANDTSWSFTTLPPLNPLLLQTVPADGDTNVVLVDPIIKVIFPEPMNSETLTPATFYLNDRTVGGNVFYESTNYSSQFVPLNNLLTNTIYTVTVTSDVQTVNGTTLQSDFIWKFKTLPPTNTPIKVTPYNGATDIPLNQIIQAKFSESMQKNSFNGSTIWVNDGDQPVAVRIRYIDSDTILFIEPVNLLKSQSEYCVTIDSLVKTAEGVTRSCDYFWYFTTAGYLSEPISIQPGKDETHVLLDAIITVIFIEHIDGNTLHDETIYLLQGTDKIESTIVQDPTRKEIVRLVPNEVLKPLTRYTAMVSKEILSQSGRSMKKDFKWDFTTAPLISRRGGSVQSDDGLVELIIPPNALDEASVVSVRKIILKPDTTNIDFFGFPYEIGSDKLIFRKSATLIMTYFDSDIQSSIDQQKISIFYKDNHWTRLGGTVDNNRVTTTILENGIYRIGFDHQFNPSERGFLKNIQIQPRIISSSSSVHPHEAAISFELGNDMNITIRIYNIAGRLVRVLKEDESMNYGRNVVFWDGCDHSLAPCVSGMYVVVIQAEDKRATKTVIVLNN